jgi:inner membrane protein YidH
VLCGAVPIIGPETAREDATVSEREPGREDATRRTYLAQERTLLAWWRSGLAALAVAIGIGRLVPALLDVSATPFVALGIGYGVVGMAFVTVGASRDRALRRDLAAGRFEPLDARAVVVMTIGLLVLGVTTMVLLVLVS